MVLQTLIQMVPLVLCVVANIRPVVTLSAANQAIPHLLRLKEDILVFELFVSDEFGGTSSDTISILVQNTTASIDGKLFLMKLDLLGITQPI